MQWGSLAYDELTYVATMVDDGAYGSKREQHLTLNSKIFHIVKKMEENKEKINQGLKIRARRDGDAFSLSLVNDAVGEDGDSRKKHVRWRGRWSFQYLYGMPSMQGWCSLQKITLC